MPQKSAPNLVTPSELALYGRQSDPPATPLTSPQTIAPGSGQKALQVTPTGAVSASTSAGGAVTITNTSSTGAGLVIYSNAGASNGRLLVVRADNPGFNQSPVYVENHGTGHAVTISHNPSGLTDGQGANSNALVITSLNEQDTTVGVSGSELGKGTIKATHNKPASGGSDVNASALSLRCNGSGTAAQGIFFDAEQVGGTTGKLLNMRQNGAEKFVVYPNGEMQLAESAAPPAAVADQAIVYAKDNGAGKTQLVVRFSGGDVILATSA